MNKQCFSACLKKLFWWILGVYTISAIVAFFEGICIGTVGTVSAGEIIISTTVISFPPDIIAALVAIVGILVFGVLASIGMCLKRCRRI